MEPFLESGMGWGLRAVDAVERGALVIEYIGEVIDVEEMQVRADVYVLVHVYYNDD